MGAVTWRCHQCGEVSTSYAAAERHARANAHGRIETKPTDTKGT